jgi:hypothetical protein
LEPDWPHWIEVTLTMPIRINLLAEDLHAAEVRRRDPVKRAVFLAVVVVGSVVAWYLSLMAQKGLKSGTVARNKEALAAIEVDAKAAREALSGVTGLETRIKQLHTLATNRVLWGSFLNAMQQVVVPEVPLMQMRVYQNYQIEAARMDGRVPQPAKSTEIISIAITARDYGKPSDQLYDRFRQQVLGNDWLKSRLDDERGITFESFGGPTPDRNDASKSFVPFTMRMNFKRVERR